MPFTLGMDADSYILTAELSGWYNLLGTIFGWDSPSLGEWVNLLQDSYGIGIIDDTVGFFLVYYLVSPLGDLLYSDTWPPIGLLLIMKIPLGSILRYPDLVGSPSWSKLIVTPSVLCSKFPTPPSRTCLTYPSWTTLYLTLSRAWPTPSSL